MTSGLTDGFLQASGRDCYEAPTDFVHHAQAMSLASLSEWFPAKIMEEGCWADIFLASGLVVDDPCSSTIYSFECVDVFNLVGVPDTGTVLHLGSY